MGMEKHPRGSGNVRIECSSEISLSILVSHHMRYHSTRIRLNFRFASNRPFVVDLKANYDQCNMV
jgi:hypothetical protein